MSLPTIHSLIIGFSSNQHVALIQDIQPAHASLRINEKPLNPDDFDRLVRRSSIDVVFLKYNANANFLPLHRKLYTSNKDCIVVELADPSTKQIEAAKPLQTIIQKCRVIHDPEFHTFHLAVRFVMQYVTLKKDFRRCKSLLYLSEIRVSRLVDSSSKAIAFMAEGKILHANIPFLVMFSAESVAELERFSLKKLIAKDEHEVFAKYLADINRSPTFSADLVLTMFRTSGAPFNAKVHVSPVVSKGQRCYQLWVEQRTQDCQEEAIPVTKKMSIWDMPAAQVDNVGMNSFDHFFPHGKQASENSSDVLQTELIKDDQVKLRFRELYKTGGDPMNTAWAKLDIDAEDFRVINSLLSRGAETTSTLPAYANFWDQLMFKLILEALRLEALSARTYLVTLRANIIADAEMMMGLSKMLQALGDKAQQLIFVIDAEVPTNQVPLVRQAVDLLRKSGCQIALNKFSVDKTSLFLFKQVNPQRVILDSEWIDELKNKYDDDLFIQHFVQKLENLGVSVLIPQAQQKQQDRLFVLTGTSFGQEIPTQDCA